MFILSWIYGNNDKAIIKYLKVNIDKILKLQCNPYTNVNPVLFLKYASKIGLKQAQIQL